MKRTLLSLAFFSFLSFSALYSNQSSLDESTEILSIEEDSDLEDEISSLEKEISDSEQEFESAKVASTVPEISTKILISQENADSPLFSSLEEPASIHLTNDLSEDTPFLETNTQSIANPFPEEISDLEESETELTGKNGIEINLIQVFAASPLIYTLLISLSLGAIAIWLYSMSKLKYQGSISQSVRGELQVQLREHRFQDALELCKDKQSLLTQIMASGISCQKHGFQTMLENMKAEGKRATVSSWQRLSLLQDIAIVAPMLGLLGTVLGMFYAFYDLNRSFESVVNLFDGFGIAVGTTVAGIGVAILAMILHSTIKFRLVQSLARVENEATSLVRLLDEKN